MKKLEDLLGPDTRTEEEIAAANAEREAKEAIHEANCAKQRVERGWDETAFWNTDSWLCRTLGEILVHAASRLNGWPGGTGTYEQWQSDYFFVGAALLRYADWEGKYFQSQVEYGYSSDYEEWRRQHDEALHGAQDALHWVADNLPKLWD